MMIALHAEPASMNARLKLSLKVIFTRLIRMNARTVVLVQMYVRLKPYIPLKGIIPGILSRLCRLFFYSVFRILFKKTPSEFLILKK
jgi:hypothetical protein